MIRIDALDPEPPEGFQKKPTKKALKKLSKEIGKLSRILQAEGQRSLLVVLQGMDASGKDGVCREVFKYCSPAIVRSAAFKKPTPAELAHDFLWRVHPHVPAKGEIAVFIRSHYEDVLIQRVHRWIDEDRVDARFRAINAFERLLQEDNQTVILKFYLHLSYERQGEKLRERMEDPRKYWKHNPADWKERERWDDYMRCYEDVLNRSEIPWIVVPSNRRWYRNYFVAKKVLETLQQMQLRYPPLQQSQ